MNNTWLAHHGIKGQKWGRRRYQGYDGVLTPAGRKRYGVGEKMDDNDKNDSSVTKGVKKDYNELSDDDFYRKYATSKNTYRKRVNKYGDPYMNSPLAKAGKAKLTQDITNSGYGKHVQQKAHKGMQTVKTAQAVAPDILAAHATYKITKSGSNALEKRGHNTAAKILRGSGKVAIAAFTADAFVKAKTIKKEFDAEKDLVGKGTVDKPMTQDDYLHYAAHLPSRSAKKIFNKEEEKLYIKYGDNLETLTGDDYFDLIDKIREEAAKNTIEKMKQQ